jgi:isoquinoline 1-oxidoreductase beta subunit
MNGIVNVSRRCFLKAAALGGGLLLGLYTPGERGGSQLMAAAQAPYDPHAFVRIGTDNSVTIIVNKSEMGQGVYTALPMLLAEELECDWSEVGVKSAPVAAIYNNPEMGMQRTSASMSVRTEWARMREAGAAAREMLIAAAAARWKVDRASCRAEKGKVAHRNGKALTYGELAEEAAAMPVPKKVKLKDPSKFKLIGTSIPRLDTRPKVNGTAVFGSDVSIPGMLIAQVFRPPVFGAKLKHFDGTKAKDVPGVKEVVAVPSGVAVVADGFWTATRGREALEVQWEYGQFKDLSTEHLRKQYAQIARTPGNTARKDGDPDKALAGAKKQLTAEYEVPYLAHATMEPLNCTVDLRRDNCEVWAGTQLQSLDRVAIAKVVGLNPEQVKIHTTFLGGGFGRRGNPHSDFMVEAAEVAKAIRKPVKVFWTREDDMKGGYYRPFWYDRIMGGLDANGKLIAWHHTIVGQSVMTGTARESRMIKNGIDASSVEGAKDIPYEVPNVYVGLHSPVMGVTVQWWRSVGYSHTTFVVEGFMDELAHTAGVDPYEFRRKHLAHHPQHLAVLDLAAEKAGWGKPVPEGRARGIALAGSFQSFVAEVAEVSVEPSGNVHIHKVVCAVDCGRAVNPSIVEAQMESGIVYGLSAALYGTITVEKGRVQQSNFNDYPVLRMDTMPVIEVHIVDSKNHPTGVGEPGVPPIAPAVTNAIFTATGKRIRRLPIADQLKKA